MLNKYKYDTTESLKQQLQTLESTPSLLYNSATDDISAIKQELRNRGAYNWRCPTCKHEVDTLDYEYGWFRDRENFKGGTYYKNICPVCEKGED